MSIVFFLLCTFFYGTCSALDGFDNVHTSSPEPLASSVINIVEELVVTLSTQQDIFANLLGKTQLQELIETLETLVIRAPRPSNESCPPSGCQSWDCASLQQSLCTINSCVTQIKQNVGCSCGPCCISDTCMGLETLFGFLSCICNKVQMLQSSIDMFNIQLSSSAIDELCPCSTAWDIELHGNVPTNYPVNSVSQSSNGKYIVLAQSAAPGAGNKIEIYDANLTLITGTLNDVLSDVVSVRFSPVMTGAGTYLIAVGRKAIIGTSPELLIYAFDPSVPSLTVVSFANINADVNALAWRSTGDRLLIAQDVLNSELSLYTVNTMSGFLTFNSTLDLNGSVVVEQALDWNPVNLDYAIALTNNVPLNLNIYFVVFDPTVTAMSLDLLASTVAPIDFTSVVWHPSGNYLLAGIVEGVAGLAQFIPMAPIVPIGNVFTTDPVRSVAWNQTGSAFGFVVDHTGSASTVEIHCFTPTDPDFALIDTLNFTEDITVINWAPNNNFALGADMSGSSGNLITYDVNPLILKTILKAICEINSILDTLTTGACTPTVLHSAPAILLDVAGQVYCLPEETSGNITIAAEDITIDLNGKSLFGTIDITSNAQRILIKNGTIQGNNPVDNIAADYGVVHTSNNSNEVNFVDVIINGGGSSGGITGYTCANIGANSTTFTRCTLNGGQGGQDVVGGQGGTCLVIQNGVENVTVIDSELRAGYGGSASSFATISTGNGGHGIIDNGRTTLVRSSFIIAGSGSGIGNLSGDIANGFAVATGNGGDGIQCLGSNCVVTHCRIEGGAGGPISTNGTGNIGINAGSIITMGGGGHGINNVRDSRLSVDNCYIQAGQCGFINSVQGAAVGGGQVIVQAPGHGIVNQPGGDSNNGPVITNAVIHGGTGGGINTQNGDISSAGVPSFSIAGGDGIHNSMSSMKVTDCVIIGGSGAGASIQQSGNIVELTLDHGGDGVNDSGTNMVVNNCIIQSGSGGSFSVQVTGAILSPSKAGDGGVGVRLNNSYYALISDSSITASNGGNADSNDSSSNGTSGAGGIGIYMTDGAQGTQIRNCDIGPTGQSGNIFGIAAVSSDGGDGVKIDANAGSNSATVEVSNCRISYTGIVGNAGIMSLALGQAIRDSSCTSFIYSNTANNIADTLFPYTLPLCIPLVAIDAPSGTPFALGIDRLANVYR